MVGTREQGEAAAGVQCEVLCGMSSKAGLSGGHSPTLPALLIPPSRHEAASGNLEKDVEDNLEDDLTILQTPNMLDSLVMFSEPVFRDAVFL